MHQRAFFGDELVINLAPLCLAQLLNDDLLRLLRADAAEGLVFNRHLMHIADLQMRLGKLNRGDAFAHLRVRVFQNRLIINDRPQAETLVLAGARVDDDLGADFLVGITLARRGRQRRFQRLDNHAAIDFLLVRYRFNNIQQIFRHNSSFKKRVPDAPCPHWRNPLRPPRRHALALPQK